METTHGDSSRPTKNYLEEEQRHEFQALEVVFNPGITSKHRRKSSLAYGESIPPNLNTGSCFLHALLDAQENGEKTAVKQLGHNDTRPKAEEMNGVSLVDSKILTKKQLSDLVLGVRELSKRFASMELRLSVKTVMILTKPYDRGLVKNTREVTQWLLSNERGERYTVYVNEDLNNNEAFDAKGLVSKDPGLCERLKFWTPELCKKSPHTFDFVVTLGGDGTVLYASWLFQQIVPPVFSFSLGSLGFLTKFDYESYPAMLERSFTVGITASLRLRFQCRVMRSCKREDMVERCLTEEILGAELDGPSHYPAEMFTILNEIVVDRGPNPIMSSTELYGDDEHLTSILADGICIATPTGSTAYSLAAGGSLCHPEIPSMLVSPICPHSLTFRPLILPDSMILRVGVPYDARTTAWASFDGRQRVELNQGDYVTISASRFPFPTIQNRKQNKDWFDSLARNFNWGTRQRQKPLSD